MHSGLYKRPEKPLRVAVMKRERPSAVSLTLPPVPLMVDKFTECHVTPRDVAALMADYLGPPDDGQAVDPSAGTGALIRALVDAGYDPAHITAIERHNTLCASLDEAHAGRIINGCFLDYARRNEGAASYTRILINPPFKKVRAHMSAALSLMETRGAVMVALVPVTYAHERAEFLQDLAPDTFQTARVHTKLIRFET